MDVFSLVYLNVNLLFCKFYFIIIEKKNIYISEIGILLKFAYFQKLGYI